MCKRNGKPRYLSVCSGIEAASVAWEPLGWEPAAFSEIEPFPSAVLAHHWPDVPNLGDMTEHERWNIEPGSIDVLAGGTPCQAFSVAGLRKGLDDHRGGLTRTFVEIAGRLKPRWIVFENVPGLLSMHDNSFGNLLAALVGAGSALVPPRGLKWTAAGMVAGPERVAGWRTLDAQFFGVPQRRRRVFVVALAIPPGSGEAGGRAGIQCVEQVLFERESVRRDTQEGDETGQGPPGGAAQGSHWSGGPHPSLNQSHNTGGIGMSDQEVFAQRGAGLVPDVAHCLRGEGFDASEDGAGRGTPIVPVAYRVHGENSTAMTGNGIANVADPADVASNDPSRSPQSSEVTQQVEAVHAATMVVRRLTPVECERLQGFPDGHTMIPWRGKPAGQCPDGPRYKAIGNSMAVPCMRWLGERIDAVMRGEDGP